MSRVEGSGKQPRAMIHKQILQSAARDPDAAMDQIADEVSGATLDLVEKVLEEYGDPAAQAAEPTDDAGANSMSTNGTDEPIGELDPDDQPSTDEQPASDQDPATGDTVMNSDQHGETASDRPDSTELTDKQLETLACVFHNPDATQGTIADLLDVTRATVSRRLNDIDGFDWSDREGFARAVLPEDYKTAERGERAGSTNGAEPASEPANSDTDSGSSAGAGDVPSTGTETSAVDAGDAVEAVEERVTDLESAIERLSAEATSQKTAADVDPELVHKVLAACMESERLDDADERRVVELLMTGSDRSG